MSASPLQSFIAYKAETKSQCGNYRIDVTPPKEGEQYRFHFDATACVGCRCCEAACNEQNGNPANVKWRRVGEMEAGEFPNVKTLFNSMGCNHCMDPACLNGCPTNSYIKLENGIVIHDDEGCIGCQYCTWNCPYEVPVFNPERGIVTKCHMCYEKLDARETPACVQACPAGAIEIEVVNKDEWIRFGLQKEGSAPCVPDTNITKPTTRYTQNYETLNAKPADSRFVKAGHSELPLVFMTVLTQLSFGAFVAIFMGSFLSFLGLKTAALDGITAIFAFAPALIGLSLSALHLGRPIFAYRAFKNQKTSWLSREALYLGVYAGLLSVVCGLLFIQTAPFVVFFVCAATFAAGFYGIYAQSMIYRVPARPSWDRVSTTYRFFGTGYIGFLVIASVLSVRDGYGSALSVLSVAMLIAFFQLRLVYDEYSFLTLLDPETKNFNALSKTKELLDNNFALLKKLRIGFLSAFGIILPLIATVLINSEIYFYGSLLCVVCVVGSFLAEIFGRYLFFKTAVSIGVAGNFFAANQRG